MTTLALAETFNQNYVAAALFPRQLVIRRHRRALEQSRG
jgi:hypothetical protein